MNPSGVSTLKELTDIYGSAILATLVLAVLGLFALYVRSMNSRLRDAVRIEGLANSMAKVVDANTAVVGAAVGTLGEASEALHIAFELTGSRRRKRDLPKTQDGT